MSDESVVLRRLRKMRVLVVEDDPQGSALIKLVLKDMGIEAVEHAEDGAQAWALVKLNEKEEDEDKKFSLIISDWNMPVMSGITLLSRVRDAGNKVPFIMITGRGTVESTVEAKVMGVNVYIAKPYTPRQLKDKILAIFEPPKE